MNRIVSFSLALTMIFGLSACSVKPAADDTYETVSSTITLETAPPEQQNYPAEKPSADVDGLGDHDIAVSSPIEDEQSGIVQTSASRSTEVRAVWLSFLEYESILKGRTEAQFKKSIDTAFDNIASTGFNSVFVHVRPFGDAIYESDNFPWSYLVTGREGKSPGFDPLDVMISAARERGLKIEAWINPYRVRAGVSKDEPMSSDNMAAQWQKAGDEAVIEFDGGLYYNPASKKARDQIVSGVREIIENYDVDGIHFDDYFYPTTSSAFDKSSFDSYKSGGGKLSLGNWRRENVSTLVRDVYKTVKSYDQSLLFGISPQGNQENNYNQQYVDVAKWLSSDEYIDYICPQIYWGYEHKKAPFKETVESWNKLVRGSGVKLYIGMAPYKLGVADTWAGDGENEWKNTTDLLARMVSTSRSQSEYGGFAMFRYASMFEPAAGVSEQLSDELASLRKIIK